MKNTHLQDAWSARAPPIRGPIALAIPQVAPISPAYVPRFSNVAMARLMTLKDKFRCKSAPTDVSYNYLDHLHNTPTPNTLDTPASSVSQTETAQEDCGEENSQIASQAKLWAAPHIAEPNKNVAMAKNKRGFRPMRSDNLP